MIKIWTWNKIVEERGLKGRDWIGAMKFTTTARLLSEVDLCLLTDWTEEPLNLAPLVPILSTKVSGNKVYIRMI